MKEYIKKISSKIKDVLFIILTPLWFPLFCLIMYIVGKALCYGLHDWREKDYLEQKNGLKLINGIN